MTIIDDIRAVKKQQEDTLQTVRNLANGASMKVWRDAEWTILHCKDGSGAQTTISMRSDTAFDIAYALTPELGERHDRYCKARDALYEMEYPEARADDLRRIANEIDCDHCGECSDQQIERGKFCGFQAAYSLRKLADALDLKAKVSAEIRAEQAKNEIKF